MSEFRYGHGMSKPIKSQQTGTEYSDYTRRARAMIKFIRAIGRTTGSKSDPKYLELVRPDETSFADITTLQDVIADEFEIMCRPGTIGRIKLFRFVKRAASVSRSDFGNFWREHHGEHMKATAAFAKYIGRYVQNHAVAADSKATETMTDYDCVEEFWLERLGDLGRL